MSLQNRFKELRRTPTKRKESSSIQKEVIKKPMILNKVELFPGEEDVSHERHTKTLKAEYKKPKEIQKWWKHSCRGHSRKEGMA